MQFSSLKILAFLIVTMAGTIAHAGVSVTATLDDQEMGLNEDTTLTVSVTGSLSTGNPVVPKPSGLAIAEAGRTSQIQIVNGQMSITAEFLYRVSALEEGTHTIPSFSVFAQGVEYKSNELTLKVSAAPRQTPPTVRQIPPSPSQPSLQQRSGAGSDLWISASVDNISPYYLEQVLFRLKLYTRQNVTQATPQLPEFKDFLTEVVAPDQRGTEVVNGVSYATWEKVVSLIPVKQGDVTIGGTRVDVVYEVIERPRSHGGWDPFFGFNTGLPQTKKVTLTAPSIAVDVKPLPQPVPKNFTQLVGEFGVQTRLSHQEVKQGDSVTLEVSFSGKGNIKDAVLPGLDTPGFKIYEDKPQVELYPSPSGLSGKKTWRLALVPVDSGNLVIPGFELTYFDPKKGAYLPLWIQQNQVKVLPSEEEAGQPVLAQWQAEKTAKEVAYQDIAPLYEDAHTALTTTGFQFYRGYFVLIVWGLPALFFGAILSRFVGDRILRKTQGKTSGKKALKKCFKILGNAKASQAEILSAVKDCVSVVYHVNARSMTVHEISDLCRSQGVAQDVLLRFKAALDTLEESQYGQAQEQSRKVATVELREVMSLLRS